MKYLYSFFILLIPFLSKSQTWQQRADFTIDVRLNENDKTLDGFERIIYHNNSPDTLYYIWFHVWPNAYRNDKTAFSEQLLENGNTRFYFSSREEKGYINRLDFKVDGATARMEDHPQHLDIIKVLLPKPLAPGTKATITTPFHVKLPFNVSRGGYNGNSFQITQWYPKPAVYDQQGWHPMPYLDQGEFYSSFGNYEVRITVPADMVVAATGNLREQEERQWLRSKTYTAPAPAPRTTVAKKPAAKTTVSITTPPATGTKTLSFTQENVHDFAWFADRNFVVATDSVKIAERTVAIQVYYYPAAHAAWKEATQYAKDAVRFYSEEVGAYPFDVVTVVEGPAGYQGGMEYPTITIIGPGEEGKWLDRVIAHEIGHNWFYGILASNEREHPWLDEGLNSFYERKYIRNKYGPETDQEELLFLTLAARHRDQPIATRSESLSWLNYGLVTYLKTARWLELIENEMGADRFRTMMQQYFSQWQFRHPQPSDFRSILEQHNPAAASTYWSQLNATGPLPNQQPKGFKVVTPFKKGYLRDPSADILFISPAIGSNHYDRFMLGALLTNYKLPPNRFSYLAVPLYAFGTKQLNVLGKLNYATAGRGFIRKTDFFINASRFSRDDFADTANRKINMNFAKLVPGFRLTFREKNARSTVSKQLQWKTFFIEEEFLRIRPDTIIQGTDTARILRYTTPASSRYLNQLRFTIEDFRALYPYRLQLQVEQAADFVRPTLTADYFFNYPKEGGLALRFFAGKFIYLGEASISKRFANERYHLNMTGPNGYEDYTYSDYFLGRSEFEGLASQQIMMRDGGFKVRTDLLANKIGRNDNWLIAMNLNSSVPDKLNPLNVLPVKIPIRLFLDIGTQAGAWQKGSEDDRFLYNAGLHLPLFSSALNIYIPLFYNKSYDDYIKSVITEKRFLRTISFSIDLLNNPGLRKLNRDLEF